MGGLVSQRKSGDGGIDGMVQGMPVQVKMANLGRPDVQKFCSAMRKAKATKGIAISLRGFSKDAIEEIARAKAEDGLDVIKYTAAELRSGKPYSDGVIKRAGLFAF